MGIDKENIVLRAGEWDISTEVKEIPVQERKIQKMLFNNFIRRPIPRNDIVLLITELPFTLNPVVRTVCLPYEDERIEKMDCFTGTVKYILQTFTYLFYYQNRIQCFIFEK